MRALWLVHRGAVLVVGIALALAVGIAIVVTTEGGGGRHAGFAVVSPTVRERPSSTSAPVATSRGYTPSTVKASETTEQATIDSQLARAESSSAIAAVDALTLPVAQDSSVYPAVPAAAREDPSSYASSFTAELLDRNYRDQSRAELLGWAQGEEAPNTLPGVPASVANKALCASLADPGIPGGNGTSPVASLDVWAANAKSGTIERVTDLLVAVDPSWTEVIAKGWEPRDPLMTMMDVTGTLIVRTGVTTTRHAVSMVLALGSCHRAPGLGAMAVQDWRVR